MCNVKNMIMKMHCFKILGDLLPNLGFLCKKRMRCWHTRRQHGLPLVPRSMCPSILNVYCANVYIPIQKEVLVNSLRLTSPKIE